MTRKTHTFLAASACLLFSVAASGVQVSYEQYQSLESSLGNSSNDSGYLSLDFDTSTKRRRLEAMLEANLRMYSKSENYMYSVPQAYLGYSNRNTDVYLGRKLLGWNPAEKFWGLNHVDGQQGFNLINDRQEGLTGVHVDRKVNKNVSFSLYGSLVHVPSLNPGFDIKDGKITSNSDWVARPYSKMSFKGKEIPMHYEMGEFDVQDIVFQQSIGGNLTYKWHGGQASAYGVYKPENNLRINADGSIDEDLEKAKIIASPHVNNHLVYGLGMNQKVNRRVSVSAGFEVIDPNADFAPGFLGIEPISISNNERDFEAEYFEVTPSYQKQSYAHMGAQYVSSIFNMAVSYIHNFAEKPSGDDYYGDVIKWHRAVGLSMDYDFTDNLSMLFDVKYDIQLKDNVLKNQFSYKFFNKMSVALGLELLRAPDPSSYWSSYRAHDKIYSNFGYNF